MRGLYLCVTSLIGRQCRWGTRSARRRDGALYVPWLAHLGSVGRGCGRVWVLIGPMAWMELVGQVSTPASRRKNRGCVLENRRVRVTVGISLSDTASTGGLVARGLLYTKWEKRKMNGQIRIRIWRRSGRIYLRLVLCNCWANQCRAMAHAIARHPMLPDRSYSPNCVVRISSSVGWPMTWSSYRTRSTGWRTLTSRRRSIGVATRTRSHSARLIVSSRSRICSSP
jgi:hypothetical protein